MTVPATAIDVKAHNRMRSHAILLRGAIERGQDAAYETRAGTYLAGNSEERIRIGVTVGAQYLLDHITALEDQIDRLLNLFPGYADV